jgi:hypothetical protein
MVTLGESRIDELLGDGRAQLIKPYALGGGLMVVRQLGQDRPPHQLHRLPQGCLGGDGVPTRKLGPPGVEQRLQDVGVDFARRHPELIASRVGQ